MRLAAVVTWLWSSVCLAVFPEMPRFTPSTIPKWPRDASPPASPETGREGPIVRITNGPVQGVLRGEQVKTVAWWGIPFAKPPVADLRFRAPQPFTQTWTDPFKATKIPRACTDVEDCLYLNVYARESAILNATTALPVMFWIYGGGFDSGDGYEFGIYDGQHLCESHNVVVVTVNYRLGNLGFMALDALRQEDPNGSTGNYGVQDQTLGLQWVKTNIAAFGGNPKRVTIFGESAGGMSVMWHLVSSSSQGLFQGAIMESGTSQFSPFFQPYRDAAEYGEDTAAILGCPAKLGHAAQLTCLRNCTMKAVLHGAGSDLMGTSHPADHSLLYPIMPVGPVIDGTAVGTLDVPMRLVEQGRFNKVPLILGANEDGGTIFEPMLPQVVPSARWPASIFKDTVNKTFDYVFQSNSSRFQSVYNVTEYEQGTARWPEDSLISRAVRDLIFMCPLRQLAMAYAKQGLPAYMYVFHFDYGLLIDNILHLGDFHAGELPFVFKNWLWAVKSAAPSQDAQMMSDIMSCKWASFAYSMDPNGGSDHTQWPPGCQDINKKFSAWPVFSARDRLFYSLTQSPEVRQIRSNNYYPDDRFPRDPKCDLIDGLSADLRFRHDDAQGREDAIIV